MKGATGCPAPGIPQGGCVSIHAPVKGATRKSIRVKRKVLVSIHAPVKGATYFISLLRLVKSVSIHAPVKGATFTARLNRPFRACFNPRAREGRDTGFPNPATIPQPVSIHAPVKGATPPKVLLICSTDVCFNPRAREGRDGTTYAHFVVGDGFQSTRP